MLASRQVWKSGLLGLFLLTFWALTTDSPRETRAVEPPESTDAPVFRTRSGLQVLYDFREGDGAVVRDSSGIGQALDLRIADLKAVRRSPGSLEIRSKTVVRSEKSAAKIANAVKRSGEISIEAWVKPARRDQEGPARIVTVSRNSSQRNFTLGHDGDHFDIRMRTTGTSENGIPSVPTPGKSLDVKLTHIVYTLDRTGKARIYLDGKRVTERTVPGSLSNWDSDQRLALGNEFSGDRPWLGTYRLLAIYNRSLFSAEVEGNFRAGPDASVRPANSAHLFDTKIAPIIATHCLECHDSVTKKGKLDLSRKDAAFAGGRSGEPIFPGKSAESLLWESVSNNDMPKDRQALSDSEKQLLKSWIDDGAKWTTDVIDPSIHSLDKQTAQIWLQRLTLPEYIETVRATVGVDVAKDARRLLPADVRADGFSNTSYNLTVDLKHIEAYAQLAEIIVDQMDAPKFTSGFVKGGQLTEKNLREAIAGMGKWLFRGPLNEDEVNAYFDVCERVQRQGGNLNEAVAFALEAMLQSPRFIYRIERQVGDGTPWPVGPYELASRLSYILWGGPPDRELIQAAERGELLDTQRLGEQVGRMLKDPRVIDRSKQFVSEWLNLGRLANMRPDPKRFPKWDSQLASDMRTETLAFFEEIAWKQRRPLSDLLIADVTFLTPELATHYGLKPQGDGLREYDLSKIASRGGLLTQGSTLTIGGDHASMVTRGLFVLHDVLHSTVKDPPPCVDTTPIASKEGLTQRTIAEARIANGNCGGCHVKFEPLAFGLEKFDGVGMFHDKDEHGNALRDDGQILFPGTEKPVPYRTSAELMDLLAESDRVRECITWKVAQFALGRPLGGTDLPAMRRVHETAWKNGGTYVDVITAIVTSDLVRKTRTEASGQRGR